VQTTVAAALLVLVLAGCSGPNVIHERTLTMASGGAGFAEVNLVMEKGQVVNWDWNADGGALYFNVHSHPAGKVVEHVRRPDATADTGSFTAPAAGSYSLLWQNAGSTPVGLHYKVTGNATLDAKHPPVPSG
jgi:hypothetical protein